MFACRRAFPLATLALSLLPAAAAASRVVPLDTRGITRSSSDIVVGRIEGTDARWNAARTKIITEVRVAVEHAIKGTPGETLTLLQLGGEVDGVRTTVEGGPLFRPGEEVLLFLWRDPAGRAQVNGLGQGKFEIGRDPETGARTVQRSLPGLAVRDARSLRAVPAGQPAPGIPLETMIREIEGALKEDGR